MPVRSGCHVLALAAGIVLTSPSLATSQPVAPQPSGKTLGDGGRKIAVENLTSKAIELTQLSPLEKERIAAVLGTRLGRGRLVTTVITEYALEPTDLFAQGKISTWNGNIAVELVPQPSLRLTFRDLDSALLDFPWLVDFRKGHRSDEDMSLVVDGSTHFFRVPAGTLYIELETNVPDDAPAQSTTAIGEAYEIANGKPGADAAVICLNINNRVRADISPTRTLRTRREAIDARPAQQGSVGSPKRRHRTGGPR